MRTKLKCEKGHHYTAKAPVGSNTSECPFCLIEEIEQRQKEIKERLVLLKKWLKEVDD